MIWPLEVSADMIFRETFDTLIINKSELFEIHDTVCTNAGGLIILSYPSAQNGAPGGIECKLPSAVSEPDERDIDLRFCGGGTEMSNSLFISYAIGPGYGFSLPTLPAGALPNNRTGYIVRFIRHGDGTDEMKFYRNDTGWARELKNEWLPANPITTLRRAVIRHRKNGEHIITVTFDTGVPFEKTFTFDDDVYPPGNVQRGLQIIAKGHAYRIDQTLSISTDTWTVTDLAMSLPPRRKKQNDGPAGYADTGVRKLEIHEATGRARDRYKKDDYTSAAELCLAVLRQDSSYADALDLMGLIEIARNNYSDAEKYTRNALEIRKAALGPGHLKVAESLSHLGLLYRSVSRFSEAEEIFKQSLALREKTFGPDHPVVAPGLNDLAGLYRMQNKFSEAGALYQRSLSIREKAFGPDHPEVALSLADLAAVYISEKQYPKAEELSKRILSIAGKVKNMDSSLIASSMSNLIDIYGVQRRFVEAEPYLKQWLSIMEKSIGPDHPEVANRLNKLAASYYTRGNFSEAETVFKRALAIREKALGPGHPDVAESLENLAVLYMKLGRLKEAEPLFQRALEIEKKTFGPDSPELVNILENISILYKNMNRPLEAEYFTARAKAIRGKSADRIR